MFIVMPFLASVLPLLESLVDSMSQLPSLCIATLSTALVYCESSICFDKMKRGLQLMLYCNGIMCWIHLLRIERTLLLSITKLPSLPAQEPLAKGEGKNLPHFFEGLTLFPETWSSKHNRSDKTRLRLSKIPSDGSKIDCYAHWILCVALL